MLALLVPPFLPITAFVVRDAPQLQPKSPSELKPHEISCPNNSHQTHLGQSYLGCKAPSEERKKLPSLAALLRGLELLDHLQR